MSMPDKVQSSHLKRDAYLYVRQSTLQQVFENTESTERQYALRHRAVALGWPMERIVDNHPKAHLVRVNLNQPQVPREIAKRSISLRCSAVAAITAIRKAMGMRDHKDDANTNF